MPSCPRPWIGARTASTRCISSDWSRTAASTAIIAISTRWWRWLRPGASPASIVHAITDGRDTSPTGGVRYVGELEAELARLRTGRIATVVGRYYAMDRDKRWERTKLAWDAMVRGSAPATATAAVDAVRASYTAGVTDEFITPVVLTDAEGKPLAPIADGDSVVFFNFRADRMRQITRALALDDFDGFDRQDRPHVQATTMTVYDRTFPLPVVFEPQTFSGNFADVLEAHGRTNLRLAETEKYAHVTYFFNCGREQPYQGEDRVLVPSQRVATYDLMPEMSAYGIADATRRGHRVRTAPGRHLQLRERGHGRTHRQYSRDDHRG